jgi:hypothetical protein
MGKVVGGVAYMTSITDAFAGARAALGPEV